MYFRVHMSCAELSRVLQVGSCNFAVLATCFACPCVLCSRACSVVLIGCARTTLRNAFGKIQDGSFQSALWFFPGDRATAQPVEPRTHRACRIHTAGRPPELRGVKRGRRISSSFFFFFFLKKSWVTVKLWLFVACAPLVNLGSRWRF